MILRVIHDGGADPFEGERELVLRRLPADARIVAARATITPIDASGGSDPFVEEIGFTNPAGTLGEWGATQVRGPGWTEIDFHTRRTLAGFRGSQLANARLQTDLGGSFVTVDQNGAILAPGGTPLPLANDGPVPGIAASRLRIASPVAGDLPSLASVRIRSVPTNVTLVLAGRPALWFRSGELTVPETTPDFGPLLAAYLADGAQVADGAWVLPFVLRSDAIARLLVEIEIEILRLAPLLPAGLPEVKLAYDYATVPRAGSAAIEVALPAEALPVAAASEGRLTGAVAESRIAWGPVGETESVGTVAISPSRSAAQPVVLSERPDGYEIVGLDLPLAAIDRQARLQVDLRIDDDGKPGSDSLLPAPVPVALTRAGAGGETWVPVELPRPLTLRTGRVWLLLQSAEGEAAWSVAAAPNGAVPLQASDDGGFSYRAAGIAGVPVAALLRLREQPRAFRMPVSLALGTGEDTVRVDLSRLSPLGRVDFAFSIPEIAEGLSTALALAGAPAGTPGGGELLADPRFARWSISGDELGAPRPFQLEARAETAFVRMAPDGQTAYVALSHLETLRFIAWNTELGGIAWRLDSDVEGPRGLAIDPAGRFAYILLGGRIAVIDLATHRFAGTPLPADEGDVLPDPAAIAVSADGSRIAIAGNVADNNLTPASLAVYDAEAFANLARRRAERATDARLHRTILSGGNPAAVAFSADGTRLYVLTGQLDADGGSTGQLLAYDAQSLVSPPASASFDGAPRALAPTPDGRSLLVLVTDRLDRYDAATLAPGGSLPLTEGPFEALAIEPGGRRALLVGRGGLLAVGLAPAGMQRVTGPGLRATTDVAVSLQGDRAVVAEPGSGLLIPIGVPRPLDWTVTAGQARPLTLTGAAGAGVTLGTPARNNLSTAGRTGPPPGPSALSQVVPVAAGRTYELSFEARATGESAAEVLWRDADGGVLATETIPIRNPGTYRSRFRPPAGATATIGAIAATAAEIRFVVQDGIALVRNASFREPANALLNGDLLGPAGETGSGWQQEPAAAPGFLISASATGSQVRNAGANPVVLRQEVEVEAGAPFELTVQARSGGAAPATAGLRFLAADASLVGPATLIEIPLHGFDQAMATGVVPAGATRAEVALNLLPGAALLVNGGIELRAQPRLRIPLAFLAEAPGELAVIGGSIAWDVVPEADLRSLRPRQPGVLLPAPTRPPGAVNDPDEDCGCGDEEDLGRTLATWGSPSPRPGLPVLPVSPPTPAPPPAPTPLVPSVVVGIGPRRTEILRELGIETLEALAAADPRELDRLLPGVSGRMAADFVRQARELLARR